MLVRINANLQWMARQSASSKRWIAICDPMNLSIEGESLDELYSVIDETMKLVLTDLMVDNELDQYLRERGWAAEREETDGGDVEFSVPWQMVTESIRDSARRAS